MGTHGMGRANPLGDLPVNETKTGTFLSNDRGTAAVAHWDVYRSEDANAAPRPSLR